MPVRFARCFPLILLHAFVLGGAAVTAVAAPETVYYSCDDGSALNVVFKPGDPPSAEMTSGNAKKILPLGPSGSGSRYTEGDILFWVKGQQALYETQGKSTNCRTVPRVTFAQNNSSATVNGIVRGYGTDSYIVAGRAGQTLRVKLTSRSRFLYFGVADAGTQEGIEGGPAPGTVTEWSGTLPGDADYRIGVFLMRAAARRNQTAPYKMTVSVIDGAEGGTSLANAEAELMSAEWVLESMTRGATRVALPGGVVIRAKFEGGRVAGRAVCNSYFASYAVEDARITVGDVGATRMFCAENADLENYYFDLLKRAETISVRDGRLTLKGSAGSLVFAKKL